MMDNMNSESQLKSAAYITVLNQGGRTTATNQNNTNNHMFSNMYLINSQKCKPQAMVFGRRA